MRLHLIFAIPLVIISFSCGKKTQVSGVVYSKNNIPVPNVNVEYRMYKSSSYPESTLGSVRTNESGEFKFTFWAKKRRGYDLKCFCDSGYNKQSIYKYGEANTIDLHLE